jgi:hypothetical protein
MRATWTPQPSEQQPATAKKRRIAAKLAPVVAVAVLAGGTGAGIGAVTQRAGQPATPRVAAASSQPF